jgi:carboxyl-terminal processing protease
MKEIIKYYLQLSLFQQHYAFKLKSEVDPNPDKDKLLLLTFVLERDTIVATIDDTFSKGLYKDYVGARPVKTIFLAV